MGGRLAMVNNHKFFMTYIVKNVWKDENKLDDTNNAQIVWLEGFFGLRTPTEWYKYNQDQFIPFKDDLETIDKGELDKCIFIWAGHINGGNCVRPGRPMCEVNFKS
jgi:hypothetical protein